MQRSSANLLSGHSLCMLELGPRSTTTDFLSTFLSAHILLYYIFNEEREKDGGP